MVFIKKMEPVGFVLKKANKLLRHMCNLSKQEGFMGQQSQFQQQIFNELQSNHNERGMAVDVCMLLLDKSEEWLRSDLRKANASKPKEYSSAPIHPSHKVHLQALTESLVVALQSGLEAAVMRPSSIFTAQLPNTKCKHQGCTIPDCLGRGLVVCKAPSTQQAASSTSTTTAISRFSFIDSHNKHATGGNRAAMPSWILFPEDGLVSKSLELLVETGFPSLRKGNNKTSFLLAHNGEELDATTYIDFFKNAMKKRGWAEACRLKGFTGYANMPPSTAKHLYITTNEHFMPLINTEINKDKEAHEALRHLHSHQTGNSSNMWKLIYNQGAVKEASSRWIIIAYELLHIDTCLMVHHYYSTTFSLSLIHISTCTYAPLPNSFAYTHTHRLPSPT